jgi:hypothetical protein
MIALRLVGRESGETGSRAAPCADRGGPSFAVLIFAKGGAFDFDIDFDFVPAMKVRILSKC